MSGNKNAIVTGSSRGIGRAIALRLGKMGYNVIVNYAKDSSKAKAEEVVVQLREKGVGAIAVQADVGEFADCERLVKEAISFFGERIDALVNNAGISFNKPYADTSWDEIVSTVKVNLLGEMGMCKAALPYLVDHEETACIVNVGSVASLIPVVDSTPYCASKSGVLGLSRGLASELAPRNVRVNTICPGIIQTDILGPVSEETVQAFAAGVPLGRIGNVEDIAGAAEYLLTAPYVTGQVITPNGGVVMQ